MDFNAVYSADCPSRPILDQIADKWSMLVLAVLEEPRRFNEIKRRLEGITQRVLTQTLRRLERNGMITRRVLPGPPLGVEYALTPLGKSLQGPFSELYDWTVSHMDTIQENQRRFDDTRPAPLHAASQGRDSASRPGPGSPHGGTPAVPTRARTGR